MKILLPVDGSGPSDRAVQHLISTVDGCTDREIYLINIQTPIDAPELLGHMPASEIEAMQEARGGDTLVSARALLDQAGIPYTARGLGRTGCRNDCRLRPEKWLREDRDGNARSGCPR
jgi:nucleotide-binding universal stress UspA family protein